MKMSFELLIFSIYMLGQNIDCGYMLELPQRGGSNKLVPIIYVLDQK